MSAKKIEHFFKNLLLDTFLACQTKQASGGQLHLTPASTVVFLRLNGLGDALVSTPLIQLVKQRFGCRTVVIADAQNHVVFAHAPCVDHVVVYRKGPLGVWRAWRQAQAYCPTAVVDLHEQLSTTGSLLIGLLRAPFKLALRKHNAALFTHTVPDLDPARHHVVERLAHIGTLFGPACPAPGPPELRLSYRVSAGAAQRAVDYLRAAFPGARCFVGLNTSAGGEARFWGVNNFGRLAAELRAQGLTPVVLTAPADWARVTRAIPPAHVFCSASFEDFAAVLAQMAVLFTPDTAAVHVAAAYGIPVFGLYVAERAGHLNWYPYGSRYDWLVTPHAVRDISYADVWAGFGCFLARLGVNPRRPAA